MAFCVLLCLDGEEFLGYEADQLNWLAQEALDIPEDYKVLIMAHITLHLGRDGDEMVNLQELEGLLTAFQKKTVYQGELVQADFTQRRNGEISAMLSGHGHVQWSGFTDKLPFRVVETPCNLIHMPHRSASWNVLPGFVPAEREFGTVTEDLWDTVVFDTKNNCTWFVLAAERISPILCNFKSNKTLKLRKEKEDESATAPYPIGCGAVSLCD